MKVNNKQYRTVWMEKDVVCLIEQNQLPFSFEIFRADNCDRVCEAITSMVVRGAGAIGATAGYGLAQAFLHAPENNLWPFVEKAKAAIEDTRPTAQNLFWATRRVLKAAKNAANPVGAAVKEAQAIADEDADCSRKIGEFGATLIQSGFRIETHCNAGWLAFVDYGTALSPIYTAHRQGKKVFVLADETRPRSQGARLTAWELHNEGVPHAIIPDNAGAWLMSRGEVDMMIVGADRVAANGDVANKIGTLEKALAAKAYNIPFYVAIPTATIDRDCPSGQHIPIEERSQDEVLYQKGPDDNGKLTKILVCSPGSGALNPAFDVTPARLVTGLITEMGIIKANTEAINGLFT